MNHSYKVFIMSCVAFLLFFPTTFTSANTNLTPTTIEQEPLRIIVYFNGDVDEVLKNKNSYLATFLETYNLEMVNTFELNEDNKGFTVEAKLPISDPLLLARELSMIENVIMIEVLQTKTKKTNA